MYWPKLETIRSIITKVVFPQPAPITAHPHYYLLADLTDAREVLQGIHNEKLIESQPTDADEERAMREVFNAQIYLLDTITELETHLHQTVSKRRYGCTNHLCRRQQRQRDALLCKVDNLVSDIHSLEKTLWRGATLAIMEGKRRRVEYHVDECQFRQRSVKALMKNGLCMDGIRDHDGRPLPEFRELFERYRHHRPRGDA